MLRPPSRPIRLALDIANAALRARIIRVAGQAGISIAEAGEAADFMIADEPPETAVPVIAVADAVPRDWECDLRASVPCDVHDRTLAAVMAVVAAGFVVLPRDGATTSGAWAAETSAEFEPEAAPALTPREREVLALLAEGASNKAIARALSVSVRTVKFHVASLTEKLGARSRLEAVAVARRAGLFMV
jgi:DNA-binding NarL/FixJ family response regulator